jgi:hypothetical protein
VGVPSSYEVTVLRRQFEKELDFGDTLCKLYTRLVIKICLLLMCVCHVYIHVGISAFFPCNNSSALNAFIYTQTSFYRRRCAAKFTKKKKKLLAVAHSSVNPLEYTIMKPKCVHIMGLQAFQ